MVSVALDLLLLKHSKRKQLLLPIADGQSKAKQSKAKRRRVGAGRVYRAVPRSARSRARDCQSRASRQWTSPPARMPTVQMAKTTQPTVSHI